ncbi:hypothetical protein V2G26_016860 [Clonostachys chloroleuca]
MILQKYATSSHNCRSSHCIVLGQDTWHFNKLSVGAMMKSGSDHQQGPLSSSPPPIDYRKRTEGSAAQKLVSSSTLHQQEQVHGAGVGDRRASDPSVWQTVVRLAFGPLPQVALKSCLFSSTVRTSQKIQELCVGSQPPDTNGRFPNSPREGQYTLPCSVERPAGLSRPMPITITHHRALAIPDSRLTGQCGA